MTWTKNQAWKASIRLATGSYMLLVVLLTARFGWIVLPFALPLGWCVYFVRNLYEKAVAASSARATQAQRHVQELTHYIAAQERAGEDLRQSEEQFRSAFDYATTGMALVTLDDSFFKVNAALCQMSGYAVEELSATNFAALLHPEDLHHTLMLLGNVGAGVTASGQLECRFRHKREHTIWALISASLVGATSTAASHLIIQTQDITDRKRAEEQLIHDAFHDALTNLPNRALFMDRLSVAFKRAERHNDWNFSVLFLDCNRFKVINDSLGHTAGDNLLVAISRRIETVARACDTIARLGGDEFALLIDATEDDVAPTKFAQRLQDEFAQPFLLDAQEVFLSASIGIVRATNTYNSGEELLRDADVAMYQAKRTGRGHYALFEPSMRERAISLLRIETELRRAIEREEFCLYYQPIVSLHSQEVCGFEALIRWNHPQRGLLAPFEFLTVAEETGLIVPIGAWVIATACRQLRAWQQSYDNEHLWMSINVSPKQFMHPELVLRVAEALEVTGVDPGRVKIEITESTVMENVDVAIGILHQLSALGVKLSVDDFGTGYSSLSYLQRFPINSLKIDRSFVAGMFESAENAEIVRTIVMLARNLNLEIVAEGIETDEQMRHLQTLSCQCGQGYYFAKPASVATINSEGLLPAPIQNQMALV